MIFLLISAVIMFITTLITSTRQLHFLQLNSYYNSRFADYLKDEFDMITVWSVFAAIVSADLIIFNCYIIGLIFVVLTCALRVIFNLYKVKNAKKPIAFTARIRRMYITSAVLFAVLLLLAIFNVITYEMLCITSALIMMFVPEFVMLINLINAPVERSIKKYYINDAKKILKSMPDLKVIGLTGSYGKTSTKYILGRILSEKYNTVITPGSYNTPMGVVITIRNEIHPDTQIFVTEMGAKRVGDIKEICDIVHPTTGIITSIGPQHLNTFGSIDNVVKTKFELADEVKSKGGIMYLNLDNGFIREKCDEYDFVGYAIKGRKGKLRAKNVVSGKNGLEFDVTYKRKLIHLTTKLLGSHNVLNILAAVGIAIDLNINENDIKYAVSQLEPTQHRLQLKPYLNGSKLIDDAYNANPSGSIEAMNVLGSFAPMKRIVVTPGLVELGVKEYECNKNLGIAAAQNADIIVLVGVERSKPIKEGVLENGFNEDNLYVEKTFKDAAALIAPMCDKDTVVIFENDLPDNYAK